MSGDRSQESERRKPGHSQTTLCFPWLIKINCLHETNRIYKGYEISSANCIPSKLHIGLNISIKLNETLIDSCGVFSPCSGVRSIFLRNYFWPAETVKRREGDKACKYGAASRDLLHVKLELTPKYWKSRLNGDGCWSMRSWSICSLACVAGCFVEVWATEPRKRAAKLSFIPPTFSERIDAEITSTDFSIWSVPNSATRGIQDMQAVSNLPIRDQSAAGYQALIGRIETACLCKPYLPLFS